MNRKGKSCLFSTIFFFFSKIKKYFENKESFPFELFSTIVWMRAIEMKCRETYIFSYIYIQYTLYDATPNTESKRKKKTIEI